MKNLVLSTSILVLSLIFISCTDDGIEVIENDSSIENQKKFESFRKDFASLYSESTRVINKDIEEYRLSTNFKSKEDGISLMNFQRPFLTQTYIQRKHLFY